jgi:hypothetical protein
MYICQISRTECESVCSQGDTFQEELICGNAYNVAPIRLIIHRTVVTVEAV